MDVLFAHEDLKVGELSGEERNEATKQGNGFCSRLGIGSKELLERRDNELRKERAREAVGCVGHVLDELREAMCRLAANGEVCISEEKEEVVDQWCKEGRRNERSVILLQGAQEDVEPIQAPLIVVFVHNLFDNKRIEEQKERSGEYLC